MDFPGPEVSRIVRIGAARYLAIPPRILKQLCLNAGDRVALRISEQTFIAERIPLERLALLRAPKGDTHV